MIEWQGRLLIANGIFEACRVVAEASSLLSQVSISPTFYEHFIVKKCFSRLFSTYSLCNFWQSNIGVKATCKMFVKLTEGVNFINIL